MLGNRLPVPPRGMPMFPGRAMGPGALGRFGGAPPMAPNTGAGAGNFLARLFQRPGASIASQAPQAANMFSRGVGQTSLLQGLNPASINGFLTNTQNVLNTARQIGPLVQQYGPIVRNLPAMWKLYKGFKDLPEGETEETASKSDETESKQKKSKSEQGNSKNESVKKTKAVVSKSKNEQSKNVSRSTTKRIKGESVPKLYIPKN